MYLRTTGTQLVGGKSTASGTAVPAEAPATLAAVIAGNFEGELYQCRWSRLCHHWGVRHAPGPPLLRRADFIRPGLRTRLGEQGKK